MWRLVTDYRLTMAKFWIELETSDRLVLRHQLGQEVEGLSHLWRLEGELRSISVPARFGEHHRQLLKSLLGYQQASHGDRSAYARARRLRLDLAKFYDLRQRLPGLDLWARPR